MTEWLSSTERAAWVRFAALLERLPGVLESQLRQDAGLTHFEYWVLAMLSEAPDRTLRMGQLAALTSATPPRLSHVVARLEEEGLLERIPCPGDGRATNARLTAAGMRKVVAAAPGHVRVVRDYVIDAFGPGELERWIEISDRMLARIGPEAVAAVERLSPTS